MHTHGDPLQIRPPDYCTQHSSLSLSLPYVHLHNKIDDLLIHFSIDPNL